MPAKSYLQYFEPIQHARADEAEARGMTVEQLLALEKAQAEALKNQGVIIADKRDAYQNKIAAIKGNPEELQRQEEGKQKAYAEAGKAANAMLGLTMPSGWIKTLNPNTNLSEGQAMAIDLGAMALLGGVGLVKGAATKKLALKEAENAIAREIAEEGAAKTAEKNTTILTASNNPATTSLAFFERPSKLSIRERLGLPKGTKVYTPEENIAFRKQINDFASKYGYEPIGEEVTDPELLERYARSMIKRHNTFYRGVEPLKKESDPELWSLLESALGKNFTEELALKYMATHTPGESAGELYISPYSLVAGLYGHTVEVTRPFKLGTDRTKWFIEGDFPLVENAEHRNIKYYDHFSGLTDPWNMGKLHGMSTGNISKGEALLLYKPSYYEPNTGGIPREITARNLTLIPQRISYSASPGSRDWALGNPDLLGSHKITDTPWQFTTITEKNGGKLNYTKFYK